MKRDFLKNLGIEDKEIIDKIMDENSADIGKAKGDLQTYKDRVTDLEGQVADKDKEISTLQKQAGDVESLNQRISQLETDKNNLTNELNTKVSEIQKSHAIENSIRDAKAKNVKAVMALLDMDKITLKDGELEGLSDQLETLTTGEDTSFLFGQTTQAPAGTTPSKAAGGNGGTPQTSASFADAVAKALTKQ